MSGIHYPISFHQWQCFWKEDTTLSWSGSHWIQSQSQEYTIPSMHQGQCFSEKDTVLSWAGSWCIRSCHGNSKHEASTVYYLVGTPGDRITPCKHTHAHSQVFQMVLCCSKKPDNLKESCGENTEGTHGDNPHRQ